MAGSYFRFMDVNDRLPDTGKIIIQKKIMVWLLVDRDGCCVSRMMSQQTRRRQIVISSGWIDVRMSVCMSLYLSVYDKKILYLCWFIYQGFFKFFFF